MGASGYTSERFKFNQWKSGDKPHMEDFNRDNKLADELFGEVYDRLEGKVDKSKEAAVDLPISSGFKPFCHCRCVKTGENMVHVYGSVEKVDGNLLNDDIFAQLPQGFRINHNQEFPAATNNTGTILVIVKPNGELQIRTITTTQGGRVYFNFTYKVN